ncbi:MAG: Ig-like surface protein [Firmicutes bacterium]|nr:Ig-like surface protein [Bacillota bacterium]
MKRRRRSLLPLFFFLALLAVMALILRSCFFSDAQTGPGNYQLSFSSSPLIIGEAGEATLEGLPEDFEGDILWSSSATNVVTTSGKGVTCSLTAKSAGTASIVAIVGGETYSNTIQIIEPGQVISGLTLNQTTATILSGNTLQLTAAVTKADQSESDSMTVTWASSNVSVARVTNDGLVTARDVGTAYITATAGNQTASCAITVQKNPDGQQVTSQEGYETEPEPEASSQNPSDNSNQEASTSPPNTTASNNTGTNSVTVTSLAINQTFGFLSQGENLTLGATVSPSGTAITWGSSNPAVATVSNKGVVTAKNVGTALITATAGKLSASYELTVTTQDDSSDTSGTQGPSGDEQIYPEE